MPNICFNTNCDHWGEDPWIAKAKETGNNYGRLAILYPNEAFSCPYCDKPCPPHDNWLADHRTHDDGTPLISEEREEQLKRMVDQARKYMSPELARSHEWDHFCKEL